MMDPRFDGEMVLADKLEVGDRVVVPGRSRGVFRDPPTFETIAAVEHSTDGVFRRVSFVAGGLRAWRWHQKVERLGPVGASTRDGDAS